MKVTGNNIFALKLFFLFVFPIVDSRESLYSVFCTGNAVIPLGSIHLPQ